MFGYSPAQPQRFSMTTPANGAANKRILARPQQPKMPSSPIPSSPMMTSPLSLGKTATTRSQTSLPQSSKQQNDWDRELESLDQKEMELHQTQTKLIREQMTHFVTDLAELKGAFQEMCLQREGEALQMQAFHEELHRDKQETQTELLALIEALQADSGRHSGRLDEVAALVADGSLEDAVNMKHAGLEQRLAELHKAHGDTAQQHWKELSSLRDSHKEHLGSFSANQQRLESLHATIPDRLAYLERALGDSADQHTGKLEITMAKVDQLVGRISAVEAQGSSLGKLHDKHASVQERLDYVEGILGDSADKHAKELEALKAAHSKHADALSKNARYIDDHRGAMAGHHATLQERVDEIEGILGLHADKHGAGLSEAASKMDQLHSRLAAVERFGGLLDELKRSHGSLAQQKQDLAGHQATLRERLDGMDRSSAELFDKHGQHLQDLTATREKHSGIMTKQARDLEAFKTERQAHHDILVTRLDNFEQMGGDAHQEHAARARDLHAKCQGILDRLAGVEKHGQHMNNLQKSHEELAARKGALESGHASMGERVAYLEQMLGDSVEKHAKELKALKDSHSKHSSDLDGLRGLHSKHSTVDERLDYLEQSIGDSADKHSEAVEQLRRAHDTLHGRLAASESGGAALADLRKSHGGLAAQKAQLEAHHATLKERVDYLEGLLNDSADAHSEKLEAAHAKLADMHGRLAACERLGGSLADLKKGHGELREQKASLESDHASVKGRLENIEGLFGDHSNRQTKELLSLRSLHDKHAGMLTRHASQLDEFGSHKEHQATLPERMTYVEQQLGDSADKHMAEVAALHKKVASEQAARDKHHGSIKELFAKEQAERSSHHATLNDRVDYLEGAIGSNAEKHSRELAQLAFGHQKLQGEIQNRGEGHGAVMERVGKLERAVTEAADKQASEAKAARAKFESFGAKLSVVRDAWGQETPRP